MYAIRAIDYPDYKTDKKDSLNWNPSSTETVILESANYTCSCCGLTSRPHRDYRSGYMEIIILDEKQHVLCAMCAQTQYLGRSVNGKKNHGLIVYCPSLTQGQIIKLAQWAYLSRLRANRYAKNANALIGMINKDLISPVEKIVPGFTSGDVIEFSDIYRNMSPLLKKRAESLFADLRYWPNEIVFEKQIKFWNAAAFYNLPDDLEALCTTGSSAKKSA